MNYAVQQRMRMIDFLLKHFGYVRREHLIDHFGISMPCASRDFSEYNALAPANTWYNTSTKRWERTAAFQPLYE